MLLGFLHLLAIQTKKTKYQFYEKLARVLGSINATKEILMLGDFNERTGRSSKVIGRHGEDIKERQRSMSDKFSFSVKLLNGFFPHTTKHLVQTTKKSKDTM